MGVPNFESNSSQDSDVTKGLQRSISRAPIGSGAVARRSVLDINATISVVGATGIGFGGVAIFHFPEGWVLPIFSNVNLNFSGSGSDAALVDTWEGDMTLGYAVASTSNPLSPENDLIPKTALAGAAVAEVSPAFQNARSVVTSIPLDNTDGDTDVYLNLLIDDADISGTAVITVTGTLDITYWVIGDN